MSVPSVYLETSIVSYLRERASSQIVAAARQVHTRRWWTRERDQYELFVSRFVLDEASLGSEDLAAARLKALKDIPLLELSDPVFTLGTELLKQAALPEKARVDALHIATAAVHGMDYLLTWNCKHIANARLVPRVNLVITDQGYAVPYICTPEELLSDD